MYSYKNNWEVSGLVFEACSYFLVPSSARLTIALQMLL